MVESQLPAETRSDWKKNSLWPLNANHVIADLLAWIFSWKKIISIKALYRSIELSLSFFAIHNSPNAHVVLRNSNCNGLQK